MDTSLFKKIGEHHFKHELAHILLGYHEKNLFKYEKEEEADYLSNKCGYERDKKLNIYWAFMKILRKPIITFRCTFSDEFLGEYIDELVFNYKQDL